MEVNENMRYINKTSPNAASKASKDANEKKVRSLEELYAESLNLERAYNKFVDAVRKA